MFAPFAGKKGVVFDGLFKFSRFDLTKRLVYVSTWFHSEVKQTEKSLQTLRNRVRAADNSIVFQKGCAYFNGSISVWEVSESVFLDCRSHAQKTSHKKKKLNLNK